MEEQRAKIEVFAGSEFAVIFENFRPKDWANLLQKFRTSEVKPDEIIISTNKEGTVQIMSAQTQEELDKFLASIREVDAERKAEAKK